MSEEDFPPSKIKAIQQMEQAKATTQQAPTPVESPFSKDVIVGPYAEVYPIAQQGALRTAFDLPKGSTDIKVTQTAEGFQVEYKEPPPSWKETTLAGQALTEPYVPLTLPWVLAKVGREDIAKAWTTPQAKAVLHPFGTEEASRKFSAGLIAVPESTVKLIQGIFTGKVEATAPTFTGSLFSKEERAEFLELGPAFWIGSLFGTSLETIAFSKGFEYGFKGIKAITPEIVKHPLYEAKEAIRFSRIAKILQSADQSVKAALPSWKGSRLDVWLIENSEWYRKHALKQLSLGEVASKLAPERWSLKEIEADILSTELAKFPRTQLVYIAQVPKLSGKALPTLFVRGSQFAWIWPKSTSMILREATFTPFVSQTQVTRMGIHPFVPKAAYSFSKEFSKSMALGVVAPTLLKAIQLKPEPILRKTISYEEERQKLLPQRLLRFETKTKQKEALAVIPKITPKQTPLTSTITKLIQAQNQAMRQITLQAQRTAMPHIAKTVFTPFRWPTGGGFSSRSGGGKSLLGKWYRKEQLIKTPKQMLRTFFGTPRKPRRKQRGRK